MEKVLKGRVLILSHKLCSSDEVKIVQARFFFGRIDGGKSENMILKYWTFNCTNIWCNDNIVDIFIRKEQVMAFIQVTIFSFNQFLIIIKTIRIMKFQNRSCLSITQQDKEFKSGDAVCGILLVEWTGVSLGWAKLYCLIHCWAFLSGINAVTQSSHFLQSWWLL